MVGGGRDVGRHNLVVRWRNLEPVFANALASLHRETDGLSGDLEEWLPDPDPDEAGPFVEYTTKGGEYAARIVQVALRLAETSAQMLDVLAEEVDWEATDLSADIESILRRIRLVEDRLADPEWLAIPEGWQPYQP